MAARWGAGEETLTIGGMELFTAGGPLQCNDLEEEESCSGLTDLALSSLDVGILGTLQGYIDNSIISIIDDSATQAENKGHFDEENELSLLTALTEILDNADDENMSPFDSIPDTELLVSPKDRDGCSKFLSLSRSPPDREIASMEDQRWVNYAKVDIRCPGPNWDLFPENISSTPIRRTRQKSVRTYLPCRARTKLIQERSDGEEEEVHLPEKKQLQIPNFLPVDKDSSLDPEDEIVDFDDDKQLAKHGTPCIINTENVPLNDLVKYMHPYCLPALTACLDTEEEDLLDETVFLEIVSDQGDTIKIPVVIEDPGDSMNYHPLEGDISIIHALEDVVVKPQNVSSLETTAEQCVPEVDVNHERNDDKMENKESSEFVKEDKMMEGLPEVENKSTESLNAKETVDKVVNINDQMETDLNSKVAEQTLDNALKGKKSAKDKHLKSLKSKTKAKNKVASEGKLQEVQETVVQQNGAQSVAGRSANPLLQESDFLIKTLDKVKKESQLELRSSKMTRNKARSRPSLDNTEKKMNLGNIRKEEKPTFVETEQSKCVAADQASQKNTKNEDVSSKSDLTPELVPNDNVLSSEADLTQELVPNDNDLSSKSDLTQELVSIESQDGVSASADVNIEERTSNAEQNETVLQVKDPKPKSLSLSEYRKRLQNRKPNPDRENENSSCSKWPSIPEPPTELAELPCLVMPAKSNQAAAQGKSSPSKPESSSAPVAPATSSTPPPIVTVAPITTQEEDPQQKSTEEPCINAMDITPPPMIPPQTNIPPPFFPPAWPTVPAQPPYYPGVQSLPAVPQFPHTLPPMMPMQPPPGMMSWPPFPPPPIAIGPLHPTSWPTGPPPPFWPNPQVAQGMPEMPVPFSAPSQLGVSEQKIPQEAKLPSGQGSPQKLQKPAQKPSNALKKECKAAVASDAVKSVVSNKVENINSPSKSGSQVGSELKRPESSQAQAKVLTGANKTNVAIPDLKSANEVVCKIMEILKKAQKFGFRITPPLLPVAQKTEKPTNAQESAEVNVLKSADLEKTSVPNVGAQVPVPAADKPSALPVEQIKLEAATSNLAKEDKSLKSAVGEKTLQASASLPAEALYTPSEATLSNPKKQEENFASETGIEASDLTSLLEEFEKSEAKDEERLPHSPDKMAVGNSGSEKALQKKTPADKHLAPELANTAGLTPPATPPHQLWKSASGPLNGKSKPLQLATQEKPCAAALKTTKLIEPKPLPQSKLKNRTLVSAASVELPAVHVGSGEHDYCILSAAHREVVPETAENNEVAASQLSQKEEGSRWNVKHHQNIVIKPIVPFNKRAQSKACPKQSTLNAPSVIHEQSANCGPDNPVTPCINIQKNSSDPLDHRTNVLAEPAMKSPPASVLMSPDSSPCRSEHGETRTDSSKHPSMSRRSLRCYRKYRNSPSPQKSTRRRRSSGSQSDSSSLSSCSSSSCSSSSSRSRSRSPPSKRRKKYRSRSHHSSRSSSRSSYGSRSSSRSSSGSSRSCSPSSSRSRSRSRSPYRRRYRSRSRRCESRDSYYRQKMFHKERAIEERRVVYIGKINSRMTRSELRRRFSIFGEIEECTIHFREEGDNYGFVTYRYTGEAFAAIENGHKLRLPDELPFDLCFGGRRQFCKSNYADLDSNRDDFDPAPVRSKFEALDFDTLLREAQKNQRR